LCITNARFAAAPRSASALAAAFSLWLAVATAVAVSVAAALAAVAEAVAALDAEDNFINAHGEFIIWMESFGRLGKLQSS
jgi:hypothetical protein